MHRTTSVPCNGVGRRNHFTSSSHFITSILGGSTRFGLQQDNLRAMLTTRVHETAPSLCSVSWERSLDIRNGAAHAQPTTGSDLRLDHVMCYASQWPMRTVWCAVPSCCVCKDASRETIMPTARPCINLSLCHAMGWLGEGVSHFAHTLLRPFWVAAPDLGCNETIGVEHSLHECSKPPRACALCHGGAL